MIRRNLIMTACAFSCAAILTSQSQNVAAQQPDAPRTVPQPGAPPAPAPSAGVTAGQPQSATTLVGCLYREDQVPGRTPNVAEKAGVLEDYILANASSPSPSTARPGATAGATGTTGSTPAAGSMFKVERIPDEQLKALVGKRVEVTGRIDPENAADGRAAAAPTPDRGPGPDKVNLPEFEAASIREVPGVCPAAPAR